MKSLWTELTALSIPARACLAAVLVLFTVFALARAVPRNCALRENDWQARGDHDRNVYRIQRIAMERTQVPFFDVRDHALFFERNPAMFMFVAELFARAGAETPLPAQLLGILLWNAGLVLLFLWLRRLLESEWGAAASVVFLLSTPFLLLFSVSIHHEPYCFFFFNATLYAYSRYLDPAEPQARRWLVATCVAYFLLCQNYWFYYLGGYLMLIALAVKARRFRVKEAALLGGVAVFAALTTFAQVVYALGGVSKAVFRLADIAAARTLDKRIEGSEWYPNKQFVKDHHYEHYPSIVMERIELVSGYDALILVGLLAVGLVIAGSAARARYRWLPIALLAGLSWNLIMIQHTVLHHFSAMYGWFMWVVIVGMFARELHAALRPELVQRAALALSVPLVAIASQRVYLPQITIYAQNIASGDLEAPPRYGDRADPPKKRKIKMKMKPKKKKKKAAEQVQASAEAAGEPELETADTP